MRTAVPAKNKTKRILYDNPFNIKSFFIVLLFLSVYFLCLPRNDAILMPYFMYLDMFLFRCIEEPCPEHFVKKFDDKKWGHPLEGFLSKEEIFTGNVFFRVI